MVHTTNSLQNSLACIGWAGQGTNSPTVELGKGGQRGRVLTMAPVLVSLLACDNESVELEDVGDDT